MARPEGPHLLLGLDFPAREASLFPLGTAISHVPAELLLARSAGLCE